VASRNQLDARLLKSSGLKQRFIFSGKFRRYFSWRHFVDPLFIILGFWQSFFILVRFRPQVVFSKGGYVSLPVVLAAFLLRRKIILHESDARMGLANRMSAKLANKVCVAFPGLLKHGKKYVFTGNPIRQEILGGSRKKGYELTGFNSKLPVILVWGGSQGAQEINGLLMANLDRFTHYFQVIHIAGNKSPLSTTKNYASFEYIEDLKDIYALTDMVIGRAGANSLFEIAWLQLPNVIVPLSNADQLQNARYFEEKKASVVYHKGQNLFDITWNLWQNEDQKARMKQHLKELSSPHATEEIADLILNHCQS